ncbi:inactive tyrosine-protein kinase 7-like [Diadema antillarum]|uniref:inactive tyrosine-protein kinase 7-like n=1 Tax=Diadema antillarum TaxID=105358 RepID=UPI003A86F073
MEWKYLRWRFLSAVLVAVSICQPTLALQFTQQPESLTVNEGMNIVLTCGTDETVGVTYTWLLDGNPLPTETRFFPEGGNLKITGVQKEDEGGYSCSAATPSGDTVTSETGMLIVNWVGSDVRVQLKSPGSLEGIEEGDRVTLVCKATGSPTPDITWYRDNAQLAAGSNVDFTTNRLKIKSVTAQDSGSYECLAANSAGSSRSSDGITLDIVDSNIPVIVTPPEDALRVSGDSVHFDCIFSGDPSPPVEWFINKKGEDPLALLNETSTGTYIFPNGTLRMDNVQDSDEASYQCICISDHGRPHASATLTIATVHPLPPFETITVVENTVKSINCSYEEGETGGIPTPSLQWLKPNGREVSRNNTKRIYSGEDGSKLVINPVRKQDEGNFTCRASNIAGQETQVLQLLVAIAPTITTRPRDVHVREYEETALHCAATATPTPVIRWTFDGRPVESKMGIEVTKNGTLVFHSAMNHQNGTYTCNATTIAGWDSASATVYVKAILKFNPRPVDKTLERGETGNLVCHATAATDPHITWYKRGQLGTWPEHVTASTPGTLVFEPAMKSDEGTYICIASTGLERINASVKIEVVVKPKFRIVPQNTSGFEGYSVQIDCSAYGEPLPTLTWISKPLSKYPDHFVQFPNGTLHIPELHATDAGNYQCIAGSQAGFNITEITLTVYKETPPDSQPVPTQVMTRTIAIAVGCAAAYILLVVGLMLWCRQRRRRYRRKMKSMEQPNGAVVTANNRMLNEYHEEENGKVADGDIALSPTPSKNHQRGSYDKLQFPRHDMQTITVIGHGAYGEVSLARAAGIKDGEEATTVMVKALQTKEESLQLDFRREIEMLCKVNHENIVKLLGVCRDAEPQLMITEYLDWGDLKQFLQATRGENGTKNVPPPLTLCQKIDVVNQVALGMEHLSNNRFIHGDLAARNCLLSPSMEVKICTMSVSQDLYRAEYHEYHQKLIPVRWMPAEAIFEDELSTKSDIWAYGIFVWEVFSQGSLPYSQLDNDAVMRAMIDGELMLETPPDTPEEVEIMMHRCWADSPKDRHSFGDIVHQLGRMSTDSQV